MSEKRTNVVLDEDLLKKVMEITGLTTRRAVIDYALREINRRHELKRLLELQGTIEWEGDLNQMRQERQP